MKYFFILLWLHIVHGKLWKNGIIHYAINAKDYDVHSQEIIMSTLSQLQREICLKFFQSPSYLNSTTNENILYISNPDKRKTCTTNTYNFSKVVVDMPIGYKCLNQADIIRIVTEMLRASIDPTGPSVNSYDLKKRFEENEDNTRNSTLLSLKDRDYINFHYKTECGLTSVPRVVVQRRNSVYSMDITPLTENNFEYYNNKLWPLGVVLYGIEANLTGSADSETLKRAMTTIELSTCVVFQEVLLDDVLLPKSLIWFAHGGQEMPNFGFEHGKQTLKLSAFTNGAPGHTAHTINNLLRILGMHMISNRQDRDNHVNVHWENVESGKEQYLEKAPFSALIAGIPYDFDSVTHAPANYMCRNCELGLTTVEPIQDHLWQRTLSMGHKNDLSKYDIQTVNMLYNKECANRYTVNDKEMSVLSE